MQEAAAVEQRERDLRERAALAEAAAVQEAKVQQRAEEERRTEAARASEAAQQAEATQKADAARKVEAARKVDMAQREQQTSAQHPDGVCKTQAAGQPSSLLSSAGSMHAHSELQSSAGPTKAAVPVHEVALGRVATQHGLHQQRQQQQRRREQRESSHPPADPTSAAPKIVTVQWGAASVPRSGADVVRGHSAGLAARVEGGNTWGLPRQQLAAYGGSDGCDSRCAIQLLDQAEAVNCQGGKRWTKAAFGNMGRASEA